MARAPSLQDAAYAATILRYQSERPLSLLPAGIDFAAHDYRTNFCREYLRRTHDALLKSCQTGGAGRRMHQGATRACNAIEFVGHLRQISVKSEGVRMLLVHRGLR